MITGFLFFWLIMILMIAAYRRKRGLDEAASQGGALLKMMDENATREMDQRASEDAEQIRRENDESTQRYLDEQRR